MRAPAKGLNFLQRDFVLTFDRRGNRLTYRLSIGGALKTEQTTLLQGTLDLLILKAVAAGELHGLGVSRRIYARPPRAPGERCF